MSIRWAWDRALDLLRSVRFAGRSREQPAKPRSSPSSECPAEGSDDSAPSLYLVVAFPYVPKMEWTSSATVRTIERPYSPLEEGFVVVCRERGLWCAPDEPWSRIVIAREGWPIDWRATLVYTLWMREPRFFVGPYPSDLHDPLLQTPSEFRYPRRNEIPEDRNDLEHGCSRSVAEARGRTVVDRDD